MILVSAGAAAALAARLMFSHSSPLEVASVITGVSALALLTVHARASVSGRAARIGLVAVATAALALLLHLGESSSGWVVPAVGYGLAVGWGLRGLRLLVAIAMGILVAAVAQHTAITFVEARELAGLPAWITTTIAGGAFGIVSVMALLPRHVHVVHDEIAGTYQQLERTLTGEVHELVVRGHALWSDATANWRGDRASHAALREAVLRLFTVARRWRAVEEAGAQVTAQALVTRMEALDARVAIIEDDVARARYLRARESLAEQLLDLKEIELSRERILAQMHSYLAAMERLRVAAIRLASTDASHEAVQVQPLLEDLVALGADMDTCSEALVEAERVAAGALPVSQRGT